MTQKSALSCTLSLNFLGRKRINRGAPNAFTTACPSAATFYDPQGHIPCIGVTPGMVQRILGLNRLPIYNPPSGCMKDSSMFNSMFRVTPGQSTESCIDLPLTKTQTSTWEYDSYQTPNHGFFPIDGQSNGVGLPGYQRLAYGGVPYGTGGWSLKRDNVNAIAAASSLFPSNRESRTSGNHNQLFCMEAHASFVYKPGQSFYFRGNGDFWFYLNNELAIDLGGMTLSAPGYVMLDSMPLIAESIYPMDLFYCERRTNSSDLRINTNIDFQQQTGLYFDQIGNTYSLNKVGSSVLGVCAANYGLQNSIIPGY